MTVVHVTLMGAFRLERADCTPIPLGTRKARALLAILCMAEGRAIPREQLAGMLWSRGETRQALASLSQALYSLRRALGDEAGDLIEAGTETVAVRSELVRVDALELEALAAQKTETAWQKCLSLYAGPFLDDLAIDAEECFADWRAARQARLEEVATRAGTALMTAWEDTPEAASDATIDRMLEIDPYCEQAVRLRMMRLAAGGRAAAALEMAERFARRLQQDLGISPSPETQAVVERIRKGATPVRPDAPDDGGGQRPVSAPRPRPAPARQAWTLAVAVAVLVTVALTAAILLWPRDHLGGTEGMRLLVRPFASGPGVESGVAEGFGDDLSTALVRRSALVLLSRESGRLIAEGEETANGATHVLHGRMRREEDRVVLNLWISALDSGQEIWAGRFSGRAEDLRGFRDRVVTEVAGQIDLALLPAPEAPQVALPPEAVDAYLRALSLLHTGTPEANAQAIEALTPLTAAHPRAVVPAAALAVAYERVAFGADDHARAAGLYWLEGYLHLKTILAAHSEEDPDLLAVRGRLALRRLDYAASEALARQALRVDASHARALEVLAETQALTGAWEAAAESASRAIALAPASPAEGYMALALARFGAGDLAGAGEAVRSALEFTRDPAVKLLVLQAAIAGAAQDEQAAEVAFAGVVASVESRPFGAWRLGEVVFDNPRASTWRRPGAKDLLSLIRFDVPEVQARLRDGLLRADPEASLAGAGPILNPVGGGAIEELLFDARITGPSSWLALQEWEQVRSQDGALFQDSAFGPLPGAREGRSRVAGDRLCESWTWRETALETCFAVFSASGAGAYVMIGETGGFAFSLARN